MTPLRQLVYGILLLVAIVGMIWIQHQRVQLAQSAADRAADRASQAEQASAQHQTTIDELTASLAAERSAQIRLRAQQEQIREQLHQRQQQIEELKYENQQLRDWAGVELPVVAQRLRQRPAITGAADYQAWLSGGGTVHAAGDQPDGQRRAAD